MGKEWASPCRESRNRVKFNKTQKGFTQMNLTTLQEFRQEIYGCFDRAAGALFNTVDALIAETQAQSFAELSLSPFFERKWSSLYEAFQDGRIDEKKLRAILVKYLPAGDPEQRLLLGVDATSIERPFSRTSPDRIGMPMHNIPNGAKAITFGWQYSTLAVLSEQASSWAYLLDQQRIPSAKTAIQVAFTQLSELVPMLPKRPLGLFDRGYDCNWFWCQCTGLPLDILVRVKSNRCFHKPAPERTGKPGTPRKDGAKLKVSDPSTHINSDGTWEGTDLRGYPVRISFWENMHVKAARWLDLTVIQVIRPHARDSERDPKVSWFVYQGKKPPEAVGRVALFYVLRFGQEHTYRFDKQALLWTEPRLRTPEQFDRWTQVVTLVHNHLVLARDLAEAELRPWENKQRAHTPQQVRRGLAKLFSQLGTPAPLPNLAENRKAGVTGQKWISASVFQSFARSQHYLNLYHRDSSPPLSVRVPLFHRTSQDVLVLPFSPNIKLPSLYETGNVHQSDLEDA